MRALRASMRAIAYRVAWPLAFLLLGACSSPARSDWSRGPYTSASQEFQRDAYECQRDALALAPVPPPPTQETYRVTAPRGGTYQVRPSGGAGAGVQSAGASVAAGVRQRRLFEDCLAARGWTRGGTRSVTVAAVPQPTSPGAVAPTTSGPSPSITPAASSAPPPVVQAVSPRIVGPPVYSGISGSVTWEIIAIEQNRSADDTMIRWDFDLVLRDREGQGIQFETVEVDSEGPRTRTASARYPFKRRLEARGEVRHQNWYRILHSAGGTTGFGELPGGREGVRILLRFHGRTDGGATARIDVRFSLDPGVGDRPQVVADISPLPALRSLKADELPHLAGTWTGHLSDERGVTLALALVVRADGQFDAVVGTSVLQRFRGTLVVSPTGELQYATGAQAGRASVHGDGPERVLVVSAAPKPGATSTAVPYSFRVRSSGTPQPVVTPVAAAPTPAPTTAPPVGPTSATDEILTNESILSMVKAGLDESVILAKITATPARFDTRTEALIELKRAGVPDRVLAAMVGKRVP